MGYTRYMSYKNNSGYIRDYMDICYMGYKEYMIHKFGYHIARLE